jgi:dipeptidyl aminopeptidase/acylaminoacyl peptidase
MMRNLKYTLIFITIFLLSIAPQAQALDIQYGTIIGIQNSNFLVQYYGIEKKQNFLCSVTTRTCTATKKTSLPSSPSTTISPSIQAELKILDAGHATLSPSGKLLAYYIAGNYLKPNRIFTLRDLTTNTEMKISDSVSYWDLVDDEGRVFAFSPDNAKLVYLDDKDTNQSLYMSDTKIQTNGILQSTKLSTTAYQIDDFIFSDAHTLYYVGNTKTNPYVWSLYRYDLTTNTDVAVAKNISYVDPIRLIGKTIVFNELQAKGYGPALYNLSTKKVQQFTIPSISTTANTSTEEVIESGNIHGVLMKPAKIDSSKTYKLLVWLHGGPYRETSLKYHPYHSYGIYDSILDLLRKDNVIVLKLDYPGSFGYGRSYAESIQATVGKTDVANVLDAVSYMKNRYAINSVYLAGNSYGGYLSLKSVVESPSTFTGVVSINGVTDWGVLLEKMKTSIFNTHFNGLPSPNNQALYDQASIVNKINLLGNQKIKIIQGQADRTIAPSQAELIYNALLAQNKNVSITRYSGEDHVFRKKKTISDLCVQLFTFTGTSVDKECTK